MRQTWYVLEDDTCADPRDIKAGKDGKLVHKDGRKVAYAPHGPRSRGVDLEAETAKPKGKAETKKDDPKKDDEQLGLDPAGNSPSDEKPEKGDPEKGAAFDPDGNPPSDEKPEAKPKAETKDMKPEEPKRGYRTRGSKAD